MKTVIRIEHPYDGNGLWRSVNSDGDAVIDDISFFEELVDKHNKFPLPHEDNLIMTGNRYCAFKSIEQIQQWIENNWWKEIIELGFKVLMIDISEYQEGNHQIIFKKEHIMQSKDITELFI
jgi:hypothetical protein